MSHTIRSMVVFGLLAVLSARSIQAAAIPAINYDGSLGSARTDGPYTVGDFFQVNHTLTMTALGVQDIASNGTTGGQSFPVGGVEVGLWSADGSTLLASITVTNADPLTGTYRYAAISPITLNAGTDYLIGALVGDVNVPFGDGGSSSPYSGNSFMTLLNDQYHAGASLSAPLSAGGNSIARWAPANFVTSLPEPSSIILCGLGFVGLLVAARRRHNS